MTKLDYIIIYILAGLTFCIVFGLSTPSLTMNDEWITVNQVNQLVSGSQLLENEGKYGTTFSREGSEYFTSRGNYLAYSLFLPIISLPVMYAINITGDQFRFILLLFWFIVGLSSLIACSWICNNTGRKKGEIICWLLSGLFFLFFLVNMYYYQPFYTTFSDSPTESAAVILTNELLFSLMVPMLYILFRNLSYDIRSAIVGSIVIICCSTYFFWSTSAKDHLLVAFLLTGVFLIYSSLLNKMTGWKWFTFYFLIGLLCWARPEYGIVLLIGIILWRIITFFLDRRELLQRKKNYIITEIGTSAFGLFVGFLPFFINNTIITKNPLIPPQYLYIVSSREVASPIFRSSIEVQHNILDKISLYIGQGITFYVPHIENIFSDIINISFSAPNGGVGLLFICPIIIPAILYGIVNIRSFHKLYDQKERKLILFSIFVVILTAIAYLRVIHGSTISEGSLPDMRYFSPLYLPFGIISIILLSSLIKKNAGSWLKYLLVTIFICVPLITIGTSLILPHGISPILYSNLFIKLLFLVTILLFTLVAWNRKIWDNRNLIPALFATLVMIPQIFHFFYVLMISFSKVNGYPYWLPIFQYFFTHIITIIN